MIMFKSEFNVLNEHLIKAQYKEQIDLSLSLLHEEINVFKNLENIGYPLDSAAHKCITTLRELSLSDVESMLVKVYWIIDTFQVTNGYIFDHESNGLGDIAFGQHLFHCIDYFDLSPIEELQVEWSHIFSVAALNRLAQLYFFSVKETDLEKQFTLRQSPNLKRLYIDLIDCVAKAQTFGKLLDNGWVKSYLAKQRGMAKITKINALKRIVLIRCIKEHRDVDCLSAANAIECQLIEEKCPELSLIKSKVRRSKTFAEWISKLRNGTLKIPT